jgi:hypothetical protein
MRPVQLDLAADTLEYEAAIRRQQCQRGLIAGSLD